MTKNGCNIEPKSSSKSTKQRFDNNYPKLKATILRKNGKQSDQNLQKADTLSPEGRPGGNFGSARRNMRGGQGVRMG